MYLKSYKNQRIKKTVYEYLFHFGANTHNLFKQTQILLDGIRIWWYIKNIKVKYFGKLITEVKKNGI